MRAIKLKNGLQYQQWYLARHQVARGEFPFALLARQHMCPWKEVDSNHISCHADDLVGVIPIRLTQYTNGSKPEYIKAAWHKVGWEIWALTNHLAYQLNDASMVTETIQKALSIDVEGQKLHTQLRYTHLAIATPKNTVTFTHFPVDMCRYDRCYPHSDLDAKNIGRMVYQDGGSLRPIAKPVRLLQYGENSRPSWNHDRWLSFGWEIEEATYSDFDNVEQELDTIRRTSK